jgi:hypothetical protein
MAVKLYMENKEIVTKELLMPEKKKEDALDNLNPPPTFLEPGGDGCELRVASCEVKNIGAVFLPRFFKILPRSPATVKHVTRNRFSFFFDGGFWIAVI